MSGRLRIALLTRQGSMRLKSISALLGAAVCALALGSCSSTYDFGPDRIARARIIAVTMPESLVAGHLALVTVHWYPTSCAESFLTFIALNDANGNLRLEVMTRQRAGVFCPDFYDPYPATNSYPVLVPPTGARKLIVVGDQRSIVLTLQQNLPPAGPRHVVVALRPSDDQPAPNVALAYLTDGYPPDTLATAITDFEGKAISTIDCGSSAAAPTILRVADPTEVFPAVALLKFEGSTSLCGRSFRTVLYFGPSTGSSALAARVSP